MDILHGEERLMTSSSVLMRLTSVTNRQTDRQKYDTIHRTCLQTMYDAAEITTYWLLVNCKLAKVCTNFIVLKMRMKFLWPLEYMCQYSYAPAPQCCRTVNNWESIYNVYIAPGHTKRSDMDHTILPANYTMPAFCFASVRQMALPLTQAEGIWLQLTAHLSTPKEWKAELVWLVWLTYSGWFTHIPSATGRAQDREVRRPKTDVIPLCHATDDCMHRNAIQSSPSYDSPGTLAYDAKDPGENSTGPQSDRHVYKWDRKNLRDIFSVNWWHSVWPWMTLTTPHHQYLWNS